VAPVLPVLCGFGLFPELVEVEPETSPDAGGERAEVTAAEQPAATTNTSAG